MAIEDTLSTDTGKRRVVIRPEVAEAGTGTATDAPRTFEIQQGGKTYEVQAPDLETAAKALSPGGGKRPEPPSEIDYNIGADMSTQVDFLRQSNKDEIKAFLDKRYGAGNYGQDEKGSWWVMQDVPAPYAEWRKRGEIEQEELPNIKFDQTHGMTKQKVAVFPDRFLSQFAPGLLATAPAQAGAAVGGTAGGMFGGPPGAIAGAVVGGVAGRGLDEAAKYVQGTYRKTPGELGAELGGEAAMQGGMAAAGPLARGAIAAPAKWAARKIAGVTPTTKAMGAKFLTESWVDPATGEQQTGVIPPWGSVATKSRALEYDRFIRNLLSGDPKDPQRTQYMLSRVRRFLEEDLHLPGNQIDDMMREVVDTSAALPSETASEAISDRVQTHLADLRASAESNIEHARRQLDRVTKTMRKYAKQDVGDLATDVAEDIGRARGEWGRQMSSAYEDIHQMTGSEPVVPRKPVEEIAAQIANDMRSQKLPVPPIIGKLAQLNFMERLMKQTDQPPPMWTIKDAHELRTALRAEADRLYEASPLAPGPAWRHMQDLATAVDDTLATLADSGGVGSQAAAALKTVDAQYREGIQRFTDDTVRKVTQAVRQGVPPDPETIVNAMFTPGRSESAMDMWVMLDPGTRQRVKQVQVRNLLDQGSVKGEVDGSTLLGAVMEPAQRKLLLVTHTKDELQTIENLARALQAFDGKLSPEDIINASRQAVPATSASATRYLDSGDLRTALETAVARYNQIDEFARSNPLRALSSGDPEKIGRAADFVIEPGPKTGTRLADTMRFLGDSSPEALEIRSYALRKLLNSVIVTMPSQQKRVSGSAIDATLKAYTPEQQRILFPGMIDDLKELARDSRFLFPVDVGAEGKDIGQSLGAASIQSNLPKVGAIKRYLWKHVAGWIADNPKVLGMLVGLNKQDPSVAKQVRTWLYRWALESETTNPKGAYEVDEPTLQRTGKQAPDGNWYTPDPSRVGKYLQAVPLRQ